MELHNMDEYLDLQDQSEINLLSAEDITPIQSESEWHSATGTPTDTTLANDHLLYGTENNNSTEHSNNRNHWGSFGLDFNFMNPTTIPNFITPDSLLKQPTQRVTRSRTTAPTVTTTYKKKKASKPKKVYCICQQPYNGKPMVQCDQCEDWFHCACVHFDPEEQEDIDWICDSCKELKEESQEIAKEATRQEATPEKSILQEATPQETVPIEAVPETRQKRNPPSTCLYKPCGSRTRIDSYCSDVCARKDKMQAVAEEKVTQKEITPPKKEKSPEQEEKGQSPSKTPDSLISASPASELDLTPSSPSKADAHPVRRNVIKNLSKILLSMMEDAVKKDPEVFEATELSLPERADQLARSIEDTMLSQLGDETGAPGEPYKNKFRSLYHNLKDKANHLFQWRVATGDLTPQELIQMASEDMANPMIKSKSEVMRQRSLKNSILKLDAMPIIKKTHKGDIIMLPNKKEMIDEVPTPTKIKEEPVKETTPVIEAPKDDILRRIGIEEEQKRQASLLEGHRVKKRKVTADVEELLGDEDDDEGLPFGVDMEDMEVDKEPAQKPKEEKEKAVRLPSIWQGRVNMPQVAEFEACARQIGGRALSEEEWASVLSPTMWVEGRIPADRVTSYITQTQYSSSREIVLIQVEGECRQADVALNQAQAQTLLEYLETRQRYAVVGHNKTQIKDFYLIPLKRHQNIPDCLYVVRVEESNRDCDLFLGVLVLQKSKNQAYLPY